MEGGEWTIQWTIRTSGIFIIYLDVIAKEVYINAVGISFAFEDSRSELSTCIGTLCGGVHCPGGTFSEKVSLVTEFGDMCKGRQLMIHLGKRSLQVTCIIRPSSAINLSIFTHSALPIWCDLLFHLPLGVNAEWSRSLSSRYDGSWRHDLKPSPGFIF